MKFCIPTAITFMALSFCSAAVDVALRGSVAHENDIAELDLATLKHAGTSTDANLIAPLVTDLNCASYAIKSVLWDKYIKARPDGDVYTQTYVGSWETFIFQDLGSGLYSIKSAAHGTYLRAQVEASIFYKFPRVTQQTYVGSFEKFELESEDGFISIRSSHGTYLNVNPVAHGYVALYPFTNNSGKFELVCLE